MQKTVTLVDSIGGLVAIDNASFCQLGGPSAQLTLLWEPENNEITEADPHRMSFHFSAVSSFSSLALCYL